MQFGNEHGEQVREQTECSPEARRTQRVKKSRFWLRRHAGPSVRAPLRTTHLHVDVLQF